MKKIAIALILVAVSLLLLGCTSKEPVVTSGSGEPAASNVNTQAAPASNPVQTVELFMATPDSWDADAETDGLELQVRPKDSTDQLVKASGTLSAQLYKRADNALQPDAKKGELIQEWKNISINEENYDFWALKARLEYTTPIQADKYEMGWLEITFNTSDGKEFKAADDSVFLKKT